MPHALPAIADPVQLRQSALSRLTLGLPAGSGRRSAHDALAVLFELASSPATAGDALAVLHELQVHQVELDVQQEEMGQARAELEQALARQTALVDDAPVAYMTLDMHGVLHAVNRAAAQLLGMAREELPGQPLAPFLQPDGGGLLAAMMARVRTGAAATARCELPLRGPAGSVCRVHALASADTTVAGHVWLVLVPVLAGEVAGEVADEVADGPAGAAAPAG